MEKTVLESLPVFLDFYRRDSTTQSCILELAVQHRNRGFSSPFQFRFGTDANDARGGERHRHEQPS
jgi:hypothetical protein